MSQKASPAAIGAFVLGALALIVAGLLVFGSGKFLEDTETFVLYFEGNARGLSIGAPASFRGVQIGTVNDINLIWDNSTDKAYVETVVEIIEGTFRELHSEAGVNRSSEGSLDHMTEDLGLRAKLATMSIVTGQLYIEMNLYPGTPIHLTGFKSVYRELPTLPSSMDQLQDTITKIVKKLEETPVKEIFTRLDNLVGKLDGFLHSPKVAQGGEDLRQTLISLRDLTARLNEQLPPLTSSLTSTSDEAGAAFADVRQMMRNERGQVVRLADNLDALARQAQGLVIQSGQLLDAVDVQTIHDMVEELSRAARSIRVFADYLERNPSAVLRGKN